MILHIKMVEVERDEAALWYCDAHAAIMVVVVHIGVARSHDGTVGLVIVPITIWMGKYDESSYQ